MSKETQDSSRKTQDDRPDTPDKTNRKTGKTGKMKEICCCKHWTRIQTRYMGQCNIQPANVTCEAWNCESWEPKTDNEKDGER